jgi:hypothetical protein
MNKYRKYTLSRLSKSEYISNFLPFYQSSYKKFRYWLTAYYLILFILTLTITINLEDWRLIISYGEIKKYKDLIDLIEFRLLMKICAQCLCNK